MSQFESGEPDQGCVAEWSCRGLQSLTRRFDSARALQGFKMWATRKMANPSDLGTEVSGFNSRSPTKFGDVGNWLLQQVANLPRLSRPSAFESRHLRQFGKVGRVVNATGPENRRDCRKVAP